MQHNETASPLSKGRPSESNALVKARPNCNASAVQTPSIDLVLSRLERVRPYGKGYTARCPAHEDRTASLSIAQGDDGRLLLHCFAGCGIHDVAGAIGLTVADLFPRRLADSSPESRRELQGFALRAQVKACANVLDLESGIVLVAAGDLERGRTLADADHARLALACERIRAAKVAVGGIR
jgi:hypothetical protein